MKKSIFKLIEEKSLEAMNPLIQEFAKSNNLTLGENEGEVSAELVLDRLSKVEDVLHAKLTGVTKQGEALEVLPEFGWSEALTTSDMSIAMPRVINTILQKPVEPILFLQNSVAEVMNFTPNSPMTLEFPFVDALNASDIAEGQEYPNANLSFGRGQVSMKIGKVGVATSLGEETIRQSIWPLINLHVEALRNAVNRFVESKLYNCMVNRATVLFDNNSTNSEYFTTGQKVVGSATSANGTFSYHDLVKMCGTLLGRRYNATHFLAHPLSWAIFAQDPILRSQFFHGGQIGAGIWSRAPQFDQSVAMPFAGIAYVPYYALPYNENATLTSTLSGEAAGLISDVYLIDQSQSLFLGTRGPVSIDTQDFWLRESKMFRAKREVGVAAKAGGLGMLKAANIRIAKNEEPILTIKQVTS